MESLQSFLDIDTYAISAPLMDSISIDRCSHRFSRSDMPRSRALHSHTSTYELHKVVFRTKLLITGNYLMSSSFAKQSSSVHRVSELTASRRSYLLESRSGIQPCSGKAMLSFPQSKLVDCQKSLNEEKEIVFAGSAIGLPIIEDIVDMVQTCRRNKNLSHAKQIYVHMCDHGLERYEMVGNGAVPMFLECGGLLDTQQAFSRLIHQTEQSWISLIHGYIECDKLQDAIRVLHKMQNDCVSFSSLTFMAILKSCTRHRCSSMGQITHTEIVKADFENEPSVGCCVVEMYAKCGLLAEAQEVHDCMPAPHVVSWTSLIEGYLEWGLSEKALNCLRAMQLDGVVPDAFAFTSGLKVCVALGALDSGQCAHSDLVVEGLESDAFIGNTLVHMYAKCGLLEEAWDVFAELSVRNVVSWNAVIHAYTECGDGRKALHCFEQMRCEGVFPDALTYTATLKACCNTGAIEKSLELYNEITTRGFDGDRFISSGLLQVFLERGSFLEAQAVFEKLRVRDVVLWNILLHAHVDCGCADDALENVEFMIEDGVSPNGNTYICCLRACGSIGATAKGQEVHSEVVKKGYERDAFVSSTLVDMYFQIGLIQEAQGVFDRLLIQDVVLWNVMILGYADSGYHQEALNCQRQMQQTGTSPDAVTFIGTLRACTCSGDVIRGQEIHMDIIKEGLENDLSIGNSLVDFYAKCGFITEAQEVFKELPEPNVVSWTVLAAGYNEHGYAEVAFNCLDHMLTQGLPPDALTFICILNVCSSTGAIHRGLETHADITKEGFEQELFVSNALVDMYAKCGLLKESHEVFANMKDHDIVSWNTLIAGYAKSGLCEDALNLFQLMELEGAQPNLVSWNALLWAYAEQRESEQTFELFKKMHEQGLLANNITFASIVKACCSISALEVGKRVHSQVHVGQEIADVVLATALIDMYGKCGAMVDGQQLFNKLPTKGLTTWNSLIAGYTRQGNTEVVFGLFERMIHEGIQPDSITFASVLAVCSHAGLLDKGLWYFESMDKEYGICPTIKHYNRMVDLFGRLGQLNAAVILLDKMHLQPDQASWNTVLTACQELGSLDLGKQAFELAVDADEQKASAYILMSNIFAHEGVQQYTEGVQKFSDGDKG